MKKIIRLIILTLINIPFIQTQSQVQTWIDYTTNYWINANWLYYGDYGLRGILTVDDWSQYTINPAFLYRKDEKLSFHGGMRLAFTDNKFSTNTFEIRPWQGARYIWPRYKYLIFDHYLRLEERFYWYTQDKDFDFSLRGRYRFRMRTMDFKLPLIPTKFTSAVSIELFVDITKEILETYIGRNRIIFVLGNHVAKDLLVEFHLILQRSRKDYGSAFESADEIIRLSIKHNLATGRIFRD